MTVSELEDLHNIDGKQEIKQMQSLADMLNNASPAAIKLIKETPEVDFEKLIGSGKDNKIIKGDVVDFIEKAS